MVNLEAIGGTLLPFLGGVAGSLVTKKEIPKPWDKPSKKPWFCPPAWVFGPVWTTLYVSMGFASYLVYRDGGGFQGSGRNALILYGTQLAFNWAWTPIFFGAHKLKLALADILCLDVTVAATMYAFFQVNPIAGALLVPYQIWLTLATTLNYRIALDNAEEEEDKNE